MDRYGNPSSSHSKGLNARQAIENARIQVAKLIGAQPEEIVFTSGGTESNNMAIKGLAYSSAGKGSHIITSRVEHPAVIEVCRFLERHGHKVTYLEVDRWGMVNTADLKKAIRNDTLLVSIMHANNETGIIQPVEEIGIITRKAMISFHSDGAQACGKIPVDVKRMGIDLYSLAGHKFYAPKGVGALYIKGGIKLEKLMHGADHERNMRPGTENVAQIVGMGMACQIATEELDKYATDLSSLKSRLESGLTSRMPSIRLNHHPETSLPNTLSISFPGLEAETLLSEWDDIAASAGAACHAELVTVSHVLEAMKVPEDYIRGTIRFSLGKFNTSAEVDQAIDTISNSITKLDGNLPSVTPDGEDTWRLTRYTQGLGCACKINPSDLSEILKRIEKPADPNVLVGPEGSDDASVYKLNDEIALVQSVDFFTPIVDSPNHFGAIAAANALSDIYAMGAEPLFAQNIVGFPAKRLPMEVLYQILAGAQEKCREAGIDIIGGHSIEDTEPKFGMVVSGLIHPGKIIRNRGARIGDRLILTKTIGSGILSTALKRKLLNNEQVQRLYQSLGSLNMEAGKAMLSYATHACTDVTGFGLLGHLYEMVSGSGVTAVVNLESIPIMDDCIEFIGMDMFPGGSKRNYEYYSPHVEWPPGIGSGMKYLIADAQTNGGLLISMPEPDAVKYLEEIKHSVVDACIIGYIKEPGKSPIQIT
jgi:selenium donor protein